MSHVTGKPTPTPWAFRKRQRASNFGDTTYHITARRKDYRGEEYIATIAKVGGLPNHCDAETEANARLMVAAPDLLEALKRWHHSGVCPHCGADCSGANPPVTACLIQETAAAIAKAEGRT